MKFIKLCDKLVDKDSIKLIGCREIQENQLYEGIKNFQQYSGYMNYYSGFIDTNENPKEVLIQCGQDVRKGIFTDDIIPRLYTFTVKNIQELEEKLK